MSRDITVVALSTAGTNTGSNRSFNNTLLVALSTADTNKWSTLLEKRDRTSELKVTAVEYERTGPIRQRQRRLTKAQVVEMAARYQEGATVYELAADFGCNRTTVAARLKKAGIVMRLQPSSKEVIHEMVRLYQSGLSLADVGFQVGTSAGTVLRYLSDHGVKTRDTHGRERHPCSSICEES